MQSQHSLLRNRSRSGLLRTGTSWFLLLSLLSAAQLQQVSGLAIAPVVDNGSFSGLEGESTSNDDRVNGIDVSVLLEITNKSSMFTDIDELGIQILKDLPVWTLLKDKQSYMTPDMFYGATEDKSIGCSLFRYYDSKSDFSLITGTVTDHVNQLTYELKIGTSADSYRIITVPTADYPDPIDPDPDFGLEYIYYGQEGLPVPAQEDPPTASCSTQFDCTSDDRSAVTWDIAIVYTASAECQRSFPTAPDPGVCTRTTATKIQIEADIAAAVKEANQVHANSQTGVTINLVALEADYTYVQSNIRTALDNLRNPTDELLDGILETR